MSKYGKKNSFLSIFAVAISWFHRKLLPAPTVEELGKKEFKTSTQNLGVRFTDKLRSVFRLRWLKLKK